MLRFFLTTTFILKNLPYLIAEKYDKIIHKYTYLKIVVKKSDIGDVT